MKCLSLFSGIGGFDLAMVRSGHEIIGACEIDKYARSIYAEHFPNVRIWEDATKINPSDLPDFDIICGGFPCQPFTVCYDQLGFNDPRGTLFNEIIRIAKETRPKYIFLENVKGLLNHDNGNTFETILKAFHELGYDVEWQCLNSQCFTPQNRQRLYIIAHLRGQSRPKVFPIREINPAYTENPRNMITIYKHKSQQYRVYDPKGVAATLMAIGGGCGAKTGLYMINGKIRMLTPKECERLQGLPDDWTLGVSDTQRYKQIGNGITVPLIQHIMERLIGR